MSDKVWDQMETTFEFKDRKKLAAEFSKAVADELPVIPLVYPMEVAVIPSTLKGYQINIGGLYETLEVENWEFQ